MKKFFPLAVLSLFLANCTQTDISVPTPEAQKGNPITITVLPPSETDTRVAYDDNTLKLAWQTNDKLLLVGYDNADNYIDKAEFVYTGSGNSFSGVEITGAVNYKAYYPAEKITVAGDGSVTYADMTGQEQSADNNTEHLRNYIVLADERPNPLTETFKPEMKSAILKFQLRDIPPATQALKRLRWKVQTPDNTYKSMALDFAAGAKTFSSTDTELTAFLAFMPADIPGIQSGGLFEIVLEGDKRQIFEITSNGKSYLSGNRYTVEVFGNLWETLKLPLEYAAEYNLAGGPNLSYQLTPPDPGTTNDLRWATNHDNNESGYYNLYVVMGTQEATHNPNHEKLFEQNINGTPLSADYHLPSAEEWVGIFSSQPPGAGLYTGYASFGESVNHTGINEAIEIKGDKKTYVSDYYSTGNGIGYALRFKAGTAEAANQPLSQFPLAENDRLLCAYRYQRIGEFVQGGLNSRLVVSCVWLGIGTSETITTISDEAWWTARENAGEVISRTFPAAGYMTFSEQNPATFPSGAMGSRGIEGFYWARPEVGVENPIWIACFHNTHANTFRMGTQPYSPEILGFSVRPFFNE